MRALPAEFRRRMERLFGEREEYESFLKSYEKPPVRGLRLSLHRLFSLYGEDARSVYETLLSDWGLRALPGSDAALFEGKEYFREFILDERRLLERSVRPGLHPYHEAGLYYLQEPSAMQALPALSVRPFDRVLDLCASPGGKSGQAADRLSLLEGGILISNEYVPERARTLSSNIERLGIENAAVLNEDSARLSRHFPEYFSRILVDAPCSGEGMFRKDENAISEWSPENVEHCISRQREILRNAVSMLSPGGLLCYSTCTFERGENEGQRDFLLSEYPFLRLGFERRTYPQRGPGEGHYIAIFRREGEDGLLPGKTGRRLLRMGGRIYLVPDSIPELRGLRVLRLGLLAAEEEGGELRYAHALSHGENLPLPYLNLRRGDPRIRDYLLGLELRADPSEIRSKGEQGGQDPMKEPPSFLSAFSLREGEKQRKLVFSQKDRGLMLLCFEGAALGFGRYRGGRIKNIYPKGLRRSI